MRIGEFNVICTDIDKAKAFYVDLLGIEALEYEGPNALHCRLGDVRILLLAEAKEPANNEPYCRHATMSFDIIMPDLAAFVVKLKAAGVRFAQEFDGECAFIYDPDGNVVELIDG